MARQGSAGANGRSTGAATGRAPAEAPVQSFEQSLEQLDQIVHQLEEGQVSLEDALRLYERGVELTRTCQQLLDSAELRIQRVRPVSSDEQTLVATETFILESFEVEDH